ncbi:hypothetical protein F8M41_009230 [Gigaspora margarita]|uniref:Crinkler effector protein N-terminal domain-containing protein n=1 Tax=Gigaspora margarita TaxID=4874 RepID=A0A8H3X541_GIGMA|nr:hypothetical protein F8M41_009230 [Gigaspora margarita]
MSVVISGTSIALFCLIRERKVPFKVTLGRNNNVSDFKKIIKNEIPNKLAKLDIDDINLWKLNEPISYENIEELQKITLQDNENVTLLVETNDIVDYWAEGQIPLKKRIHVIVEIVEPMQPAIEHLTKKRRIEQGWKSYKASDDAFQNLYVGKSITLPHLGQVPKHFGGYQERTLLVTKQMIDIWDKISADSDYSIKRVVSGPMGVGKSYISYFLASKAYAEEWPILYIADASDLNVDNSDSAGKVICRYFLAQNKDILTATELEKIVENVRDPSVGVEVAIAGQIIDLIKLADRKVLFIVDEHGILFEKNLVVPLRIPLLIPLMNLSFWGEHYKFVRVIFTGTAHARYEMEYMKNGQSEFWVIYVGPLQSDVFDILLQMHPVLRIQGIKEEAKKVTNCVPRELIYLVEYIKKLDVTINNFRQVLKEFEIERADKILAIAQKYYYDLQKNDKIRYYKALTAMFLPSKPVVQFEWKFPDLGIIYRYKEGATHYLPLCPSAQKALLEIYKSFDLPENTKNQLRVGSLDGEEFENVLFNRLVSKCNETIQLNATDLNNNNRKIITLHFNVYDLIKSPQLSLGPGNDKVLGRGFKRYPRFDYMLGPIFIQVSISDFTSHNSNPSKNIRQAFEPMSEQAGISLTLINKRNQIEMYLDEMYGPGHSAKIDSRNRFIVTRNGKPVPGFRIVYIRGSPGTPNHSGKVRDFPDIAHVTFEEIKRQLFPNIV